MLGGCIRSVGRPVERVEQMRGTPVERAEKMRVRPVERASNECLNLVLE